MRWMVVWMAVLVLSGCGDLQPAGAVAEVLAPSAWVSPAVSEGGLLAARVLGHEGAGWFFDGVELGLAAMQIDAALAAVRRNHPELRDVTARPEYVPGVLVLTVDRGLAAALEALVDGASGTLVLDTGFAAFDRAAADLGAEAVVLVVAPAANGWSFR